MKNILLALSIMITGALQLRAQDRSLETSGIAAEQQGSTVVISWTVASELNIDFYMVERSSDAIHFQSIAIVDISGNSNLPMQYSKSDPDPGNGTVYYRIRETDNNGESVYSAIVSLNISGNISSAVFPNPVSGNQTYFRICQPNTEVKVMNRNGKVVFSKMYEHEGDAAENIKEHLLDGIYFVSFVCGHESKTIKLLVN